MTREILFRGKRLDNGEWVEGAYCPKNCDSPFGPMIDKPSIIKLDAPFDGFWFDVHPDSVGQYTGLTDKNGKKIFEWDIVKPLRYVTSINDIEPVEYDGGGFSPFAIPGWECTIEPRDVTVIGNKWDNPELLEDEG